MLYTVIVIMKKKYFIPLIIFIASVVVNVFASLLFAFRATCFDCRVNDIADLMLFPGSVIFAILVTLFAVALKRKGGSYLKSYAVSQMIMLVVIILLNFLNIYFANFGSPVSYNTS